VSDAADDDELINVSYSSSLSTLTRVRIRVQVYNLSLTIRTRTSGVFTVTRTSPLTRKSVAIIVICAKTFFYILALLR